VALKVEVFFLKKKKKSMNYRAWDNRRRGPIQSTHDVDLSIAPCRSLCIDKTAVQLLKLYFPWQPSPHMKLPPLAWTEDTNHQTSCTGVVRCIADVGFPHGEQQLSFRYEVADLRASS
jgi:hypothetical protein